MHCRCLREYVNKSESAILGAEVPTKFTKMKTTQAHMCACTQIYKHIHVHTDVGFLYNRLALQRRLLRIWTYMEKE